MSAATVSIVIGAVCLLGAIIAVVILIALMRPDHGKHGEQANVIRPRPLAVDDDTHEMSSFDRIAFSRTQERIAMASEHALFVQNDEEWIKDMRSIFTDTARIEADLNSQRLAFPEWIWHESRTSV